MAKYWFAHFRKLEREDFGLKSSGHPIADRVLDRHFLGAVAGIWMFRWSRPISIEGFVAVGLALAALAGGIVAFALIAGAAPVVVGATIVGWIVAVALAFAAIAVAKVDPIKTVEDYNAERLAAYVRRPEVPWMRWKPSAGREGK